MLKPPIVNACNTVHFRDLLTPVLDPVLGESSEQAKRGPSLISCCLSKHCPSSPLGLGEELGTCLFQWETATRLLYCFLLLLSTLWASISIFKQWNGTGRWLISRKGPSTLIFCSLFRIQQPGVTEWPAMDPEDQTCEPKESFSLVYCRHHWGCCSPVEGTLTSHIF